MEYQSSSIRHPRIHGSVPCDAGHVHKFIVTSMPHISIDRWCANNSIQAIYQPFSLMTRDTIFSSRIQWHMINSNEARASRTFGKSKSNFHTMMHVGRSESFRILWHCKTSESKGYMQLKMQICTNHLLYATVY